MITADQIRAARALLRLDQSDLAHRAGVSLATLRRVERGAEKARASTRAVMSIQHRLKRQGRNSSTKVLGGSVAALLKK